MDAVVATMTKTGSGVLDRQTNGYGSPMSSSVPVAVGELSEVVVEALLDGVGPPSVTFEHDGADPLDHDLQLALFVLNELHFAGWVGVDDDMEWNPAVTAMRRALTDEFERRLRHTLPASSCSPVAELRRLLDLAGPSVSRYLRDQRRLRGVVLGQLSLFEMGSVIPNQRMVDCCDRLDLDERVRLFFHVHVLADTEHQVMVEASFLVEYPRIDPKQVDNLLLGMRARSLIDHALARNAVPSWQRHRGALSVVPTPAVYQAS